MLAWGELLLVLFHNIAQKTTAFASRKLVRFPDKRGVASWRSRVSNRHINIEIDAGSFFI
jgi:predicted ferric reductase